ncbi:MAG: NAD(P)H-dependent oxidoreductase [Epsilonproteobacteria bacterium]|nr:NAD(P)H-dependent oxidoreductase [Campylobacterota bacterium]
MNKKEMFMEAINFRHACKLFDEDKKITDEDIKYILETGRLSPSSFGMEGWKFLVITNQPLKEELKEFCWNQPQITTCSHLVVVLAAINPLKPQSGIPQKRFQRRDMPQEMIERYVDVYKNYIEAIGDDKNIFAWGARQTYIAAANMMNAAAAIGIDSCPIEGFEKGRVDEILKLDTKEFQTSLILPFGYRAKPQPERLRLDFDEVVEYIS